MTTMALAPDRTAPLMSENLQTPTREHLERIRKLAIARWGTETSRYDRPVWESELVKAYVEIVRARGEEKASLRTRRHQILRAFEKGSCTADTLFYLYMALNCRVKVVQEKEVE